MEINLPLDSKIESYLFYKGEVVSVRDLANIFNLTELEIKEALDILSTKLKDRGLSLVRNNNEVSLGTNKEMSSLFEKIRREDLSKDLSRASLETLSIILYKNPVSRPEIDYIRGVNSVYILRNLEVRGLINKRVEKRTSVYEPSLELLSYMGVSSIEELPDYKKINNDLNLKSNNVENGDEK